MGSPICAQVPGGGSHPPACAAARLISFSPLNRSMKQWSANRGTRIWATWRSVVSNSSQRPAARDPLEQAEPVRLALGVPASGLADEHHHAVDVARRAAQKHRELPQEHMGAVAAAGRQRVFPRHSAQYLAGQLVALALLVVRDKPDRVEGLAGQRRGLAGEPEQSACVFVYELYVAVSVRDDDADLRLAQNEFSRQIPGGEPSFQRVIATLRSKTGLLVNPGTRTRVRRSRRLGRRAPSVPCRHHREPELHPQPSRATPRVRVVSRRASV